MRAHTWILAMGALAGAGCVAAPPADTARVRLPALTGEQAAALAAALDDVGPRVLARLSVGAGRDTLARALRELRAGLPTAAAPELLRRVRRARVALDALGRAPPPRGPVDTALVRVLLDQVDGAARRAPARSVPVHGGHLPP